MSRSLPPSEHLISAPTVLGCFGPSIGISFTSLSMCFGQFAESLLYSAFCGTSPMLRHFDCTQCGSISGGHSDSIHMVVLEIFAE